MNEPIEEIERVFLALGDRTRIRLVNLMRDGAVTVNYLCEALGESQPKVSRHLAYLRSMKMVNTRRDGKWIYYSLCEPKNPFGRRLLNDTIAWTSSISQGETDKVPLSSSSRQTDEKPSQSVPNNTYGQPDISATSEELEVYLL